MKRNWKKLFDFVFQRRQRQGGRAKARRTTNAKRRKKKFVTKQMLQMKGQEKEKPKSVFLSVFCLLIIHSSVSLSPVSHSLFFFSLCLLCFFLSPCFRAPPLAMCSFQVDWAKWIASRETKKRKACGCIVLSDGKVKKKVECLFLNFCAFLDSISQRKKN